MDLNELVKKLTSGDIPTGALGAFGIVALVIAVRTAGRVMRFLFILAGLALLGGAVWWHLHRR